MSMSVMDKVQRLKLVVTVPHTVYGASLQREDLVYFN